MPLLPDVTTEQLEDHFFGSGAFTFGWFKPRISSYKNAHFPVVIDELDEDGWSMGQTLITEEDFKNGIMKYAASLPDRTYQDLIEDMDAGDVDACIQLLIFDEIKYSD